MRHLFTILFSLAGLCGPAQAQVLDPHEFTQQFAQVLGAALPTAKIVIKKDLEIAVIDASGKESSAFLANAFNEYSHDPARVDQVIRAYVSSMAEPRAAHIDRARIIPIIKDRRWLDETREAAAHAADSEINIVFEDFNGALVVLYAEDTANSIRYLSPKNLKEIGVPREQLRALGVANLKKLLPKIEMRGDSAFSMITAGGDYEASLLLFDDIWSGGRIKVDGDIVVAVPSRDVLLVTGSRNEGGMAKVRQLATKIAKEATYRLTDALFVYREGRFTVVEAK